ncbi:MAG: 3-dehydroquinate synthase [bacterium]
MKTVLQKISVPFAYPVCFTHHVFAPTHTLLATLLAKKRSGTHARVLAVVDAGLAKATPPLVRQIEAYFHAHRDTLALVRSPLLVPGGENAKNGWGNVREIMSAAGVEHLDRHSYVLAIGGGGVLDMAGFAASLVHRGLRFVRIPTTVLAQSDAGVGVKNGMNEGGAKNFAGTFAPPFAVINDFAFLKTLPQQEWIGGVSEAFKVAIIKDKPFFRFLCKNAGALRNRDQAVMEKVVEKTARLHLSHIASSGDPFEFGSSRPLDFGHWAAHRLELMSNFTLGHSSAVAIGIALDSTYAMLKGMISPSERTQIVQGLADCGMPVWSPLLERAGSTGEPDVLRGLEQFREHLGGRLCITLPRPIGKKHEVHSINVALVKKAISLLDRESQSPRRDAPAHKGLPPLQHRTRLAT